MNSVRITMPDGTQVIACGRFPTQLICDVCDRPVQRTLPKFTWRGIEIDLCPACRTRYEGTVAEPEFIAWADTVIAKHYPQEAPPADPTFRDTDGYAHMEGIT